MHHIEPWSPIFPSTDPKYLAEFRAAVEKAKSSVVDIAVDGRHSQYSKDPAERQASVKATNQWIDVAVALGSPSIRTHIDGGKDSKPDVALTAETLARNAEYGAKKNVVVHLENDNPISEDPFFIAQIIEKVNSPWLRALPDFGNSLAAHGPTTELKGLWLILSLSGWSKSATKFALLSTRIAAHFSCRHTSWAFGARRAGTSVSRALIPIN